MIGRPRCRIGLKALNGLKKNKPSVVGARRNKTRRSSPLGIKFAMTQ